MSSSMNAAAGIEEDDRIHGDYSVPARFLRRGVRGDRGGPYGQGINVGEVSVARKSWSAVAAVVRGAEGVLPRQGTLAQTPPTKTKRTTRRSY